MDRDKLKTSNNVAVRLGDFILTFRDDKVGIGKVIYYSIDPKDSKEGNINL